MSSEQKLDIFISYPWKIKPYVDELFVYLVSNQYKVWMDSDVLNAGSILSEEIHKAILDAKVFICCINRDYLSSVMCNKEIQYAFDLGKTIIPIMFEEMSTEKLGKVGFIISGQLQIRVYDNPSDWNGISGQKLMNSLNKHLSINSSQIFSEPTRENSKEVVIEAERKIKKTPKIHETLRDNSYSSLTKPEKVAANVQPQLELYNFSNGGARDTPFSTIPVPEQQQQQQVFYGYADVTRDSYSSLSAQSNPPQIANQNQNALANSNTNYSVEQTWYNYTSYAPDVNATSNYNVPPSQYQQNKSSKKKQVANNYTGYDVNSYVQQTSLSYLAQPLNNNAAFKQMPYTQPQQVIQTTI